MKIQGRQQKTWTIVQNFVDHLANKSPPWAAYRAFMYGRPILLDKHPGVCPVGVGESWRRFFSKCVLRVTGPEATNMCQGCQLCAEIKAIIGGTVNGLQAIWDTKSTTED